jgi:GH25 family lysozyme M1 (1,4-beta-N-acetylmuramidase)
MDTNSGQYHRDNNNLLILPKFKDLQGQVDFAFIKSSEGSWIDPDFRQVWNELAAPASIRGLYHYQRSSVSWQQQADNVLSITPADCQIVALDIEKTNNVLDKTFFADASRMIAYWKAAGKKVIYYVNQDVYMNYLLPIMQANYPTDLFYLNTPAWYAQYAFWKPNRDPNNQPKLPNGMTAAWRFWQYNDAGDTYPYGVFGSPDLDVFNGTLADLSAFVGAPTPPPPAPGPTSSQWTITEQSLNSIHMERQ